MVSYLQVGLSSGDVLVKGAYELNKNLTLG